MLTRDVQQKMIIMLKEGWYTPRVQGAEGTTEETDEQTMKKGRET